MQPGVSADDFMRSYADKPMVDAALKQQQAEVNALEKEWKQANSALSTYDSKVSSLEGKLNRTKKEAGSIQQNMAKAGPASEKMANLLIMRRKVQPNFPCVYVKLSGARLFSRLSHRRLQSSGSG